MTEAMPMPTTAPLDSAVAAPAIDLQHVTRRFGGVAVVDDVTLAVPGGSICGFVGLNGAGKSTTIRMAVGLLRPHAGTIRVAGCDVIADHVELCRRIGYVPDRPNVYGWMRAGEAVLFVKRFHGQRWNQSRCDDLIKRFRLPLDQRVAKLSKGQAAKLQLLLACCHDPQVLILDEPTSGFDPIVREEFLESVLRVAGEREQAVLFSSHALGDVQRLADRIAILHEGKLLMEGSTDELLSRVKRVRLVLSDSPADPPPIDPSLCVLRDVRDGRVRTLTLDGDVSADAITALRTATNATAVEVFDLSLDDLFKDLVRGKEEGACSPS